MALTVPQTVVLSAWRVHEPLEALRWDDTTVSPTVLLLRIACNQTLSAESQRCRCPSVRCPRGREAPQPLTSVWLCHLRVFWTLANSMCSEDGWHDGWMYEKTSCTHENIRLTTLVAVGLIIGFIFGAHPMRLLYTLV